MISRLESLLRDPLLIIGAMWPLVLLANQLPLPIVQRPAVSGLPWRQELALTFLITLTLGILLNKGNVIDRHIRIDRKRLIPLGLAALFVLWILLSATWATDPYQAVHLGLQWTSYLVFFVLMTVARARVIRASFISLAVVVWILAISCAIESWFGAPLTDFNLLSGAKPLLRGSSGFGEITGAACILFAAFALHLNRRRVAVLCGITALAGWLGTLQSLERAPLIGTCAGLLLLSVAVFFEPSKTLFRRLGLLAAIFTLVFLVQTVPNPFTKHDVSTVTRLTQNLNTDPNTRVRFLFWGVGLEMVRAHPLLGVGGNNYQTKFGEGRAQFSARYPTSPFLGMNDDLLTLYAHNEYVQMAAELGITGLILFVLFALSLVVTFIRRLKLRDKALPVLGAGGAMLTFAISSGASASSFRYTAGGLVFFFAAALINRRSGSHQPPAESERLIQVSTHTVRYVHLCFLPLMLFCVALLTAQAAGITLHAWAETAADATQAERYYRRSLAVYPTNNSAKFSYGMWLNRKGRSTEGVHYLQSAVDRGFNNSVCFAYLAGAQASAGDLAAAEQTLAQAVKIYPVSVFLIVRHAAALERNGSREEAQAEFSRAVSIDSRKALGWRELIDNDIDAALQAAQQNNSIAMPSELSPESAVLAIMQENERRFPDHVNTGFRARMRIKL